VVQQENTKARRAANTRTETMANSTNSNEMPSTQSDSHAVNIVVPTQPTFHIEPHEIDQLHDPNATNYQSIGGHSPAAPATVAPSLLRQRSSRLVKPSTWIVPPVELHPADINSEWRHKWLEILESHRMHLIILSLVLLDLGVVVTEIFIELLSYQQCIDHEAEFEGDKFEVKHSIEVTEDVLRWTSLAILSIFVAELIAKIIVFRLQYYYKNAFHTFDGLIILLSFFSTIFLHGIQETIVTFFIFLRLWRVFRIIDGVAVALEDEHDMEKEQMEAKIKKLEGELQQLRTSAQHTLQLPACDTKGSTKLA
jgi:hypothetical protein